MMRQIGERCHNLSFSDVQLDEQLKALHLVIEYLEGRGDSAIVVASLQRDRETFEGFKRARQGHRKPDGLTDQHTMDESPVAGCECRMCDSARAAKM